MPRRLRLLRTVRSELPFAPFSVAKARVYDPSEIDINPHGAVSVMTPGGWLGIKPDEMEWLDSAPAEIDNAATYTKPEENDLVMEYKTKQKEKKG